MTPSVPDHVFDPSRASEYEPRPGHQKTAILVDVAEDAVTVLRTGFGDQTMRGPFYVIAADEGTYGAARSEFEASHEQVGPSTYRKTAPVLAYRLDAACRVHTDVDSARESSVAARPGDWIVRQRGGEVMVVAPEAFDERYRPVA